MATTEQIEKAFIGVDVGGTHTDVSVLLGDRLERGKALTTYDDFSRGVLEAVAVVAGNIGISVNELLDRTQLFINGTTVVTNSITELTGSNVGVIVTHGFKDAFRFAGGPRTTEIDDHLQVNVPDLVNRLAIAEVEERIDWSGTVLVPLDLESLRAAASRLVAQGAEALSICFLWSHINPEHELAAESAIAEMYPELFITLSHRVFPVAGETRRWTTAILNSFVQRNADVFLTSLDVQLRSSGLRGGLAFFQGLGGAISLDSARQYPLGLLGSGPAGGALGANELAKTMGYERVLLGDMGGTSFDTGIIIDNEIRVEKNLQLGPFQTGVNIVDVVSIGAGGGSLAWVSERGVPQVGPHSAGSTPGPAALGRGGTQATVTDAMIAMGFIDPDRYLGGRVKLQPELSAKALDETFADKFNWTTEESAAVVHDLVVVNMANAVREVTVGKGHDAREFLFIAYGGTLPMFAAQIADRLGIKKVIIPQNSSVFCALGLLASDFVMRTDRGVGWDLSKPQGAENVSEIAASMMAQATQQMTEQGFSAEQVDLRCSGDFRYMGQTFELTLSLPNERIHADQAATLSERFLRLYEDTYGEGTAWKGVPIMLVNFTVTVTGRQERPQLHPDVPTDLKQLTIEPQSTRSVFLPGSRQRREIPVYGEKEFAPGVHIEGPAIVDGGDTTIYVPANFHLDRDGLMNYVLTHVGS